MPVEIRELTIKVQVDNQPASNAQAGSGGDNAPGDNSAVVKEAVEEVMRILDSKKER